LKLFHQEDQMPRSQSPRLRPNPDWPPIIDDVLGSNADAHKVARVILWQEVGLYVERVATLPIGPLNDDEDARRDIGLSVLKKLEGRSNLHLKEWRARQRRKQDHASWWGWIKTVARCVSIDYARTSRLNVARRGEPYKWVGLESIDPFVLGETLGSALDFLVHCGEQELHEYIANVQSALSDDSGATVGNLEGHDVPPVRGNRAALRWP
jgi:hypothetical protein